MKRGLLIALGWLSVALGTAGIFLPLLPTTVFIIIASWCFARSSERFHHWLHTHPKLGPIITSWESGQGIPQRTKVRALTLLWCSIGVSIYVVNIAIESYSLYLRIALSSMLLIIATAVSIYLYRLPSANIKD